MWASMRRDEKWEKQWLFIGQFLCSFLEWLHVILHEHYMCIHLSKSTVLNIWLQNHQPIMPTIEVHREWEVGKWGCVWVRRRRPACRYWHACMTVARCEKHKQTVKSCKCRNKADGNDNVAGFHHTTRNYTTAHIHYYINHTTDHIHNDTTICALLPDKRNGTALRILPASYRLPLHY